MRLGVARNGALVLGAVAAGYWLALRPRHLRWGATAADLARRWPGDELVDAPYMRAVRAITVKTPAEKVWPWIMQVGRDRGGFYSYTWLENLVGADIHNVDHVMPELPDRRPGDTVAPAPRPGERSSDTVGDGEPCRPAARGRSDLLGAGALRHGAEDDADDQAAG